MALNINYCIFTAKYKAKMRSIVGREKELKFFKKITDSNNSEFVAVYGRRRVGKTFLIRSAYSNQFTFTITAIGNATLSRQLTNFNIALQKVDSSYNGHEATNWQQAFQFLIKYLEKSKDKRKIVFFDELPWFDTPRSGFVQSLEHFWNSWASARDDIVFIVCGSAASWMLNKLINGKGGLHNRLTRRLKLNPFTLKECGLLLKSNKIVLDKYQVAQLYMSMGGIPYYWEHIEPGLSAMQNIENICFGESGFLRGEFNNLFSALFSKHQRHEKIVLAIAKKLKGLTREEIIIETGLPDAGSTTRLLNELEESGFIRKYFPFGKKLRNSLYQLSDFYSLFYLKFIKDTSPYDKNTWLNKVDSPQYRAWSGYAYEQLCLYHLTQIKRALGISGVETKVSSWKSEKSSPGVQIDLVIDRRDQVVNLCEMKFSISKFTIDNKYAENLRNKIGAFKAGTGTRKSLFLTMVTTFGLNENMHSTGLVQNSLTLDDLFD